MSELVKYDAACRAIAEAKSIDEAKDIRDKSIAIAAYARQAKNKDLEADSIEIRMRAERRLGQMLTQAKDAGLLTTGRRWPRSNGASEEPLERVVLAEVGVDKKLSACAQTLAELQNEKFESAVADARDAVSRVTRNIMKTIQIEASRGTHRLDDGCTVADLDNLVASGRKFGVIYADPPWSFNVYSGKGKSRSADKEYDTQSLDWIKSLPIEKLAAEDCALMMWAVMPELPGAIDVIKAWGFEYKTVGFTWVKQVSVDNPNLAWGMGYWTRANAELCLLASRGSPRRQAKDVHQVIMSPVGEHSRKPEEASARIERLLPGPYLELFARRPMAGWTVWGNQIERGLFNRGIPEMVA